MGSLFAALTTAVSGLNAQSSAIGNISENLANAQTVGYKSVSTNFEQLVNASNAFINNPGGVRSTPEFQNDVQGSIVGSNTATSLAISGQGYFAVETATTDANGVTSFNPQTFYTRKGDFTLDKNGFLVNGSGYFLTGWGINTNGTVNTSTTAPIQISALLNDPVAAKNINYAANLPSNAAIGYTAPASTLLVFDSLGNSHNVNYTWTKTANNAWNLNVSIPDALDANGNAYSSNIPFTFNNGSTGTAGTIQAIGPYVTSNPNFTVNAAPPGAANFTFGTSGSGQVEINWAQLENVGASPIALAWSKDGVAQAPIAGVVVSTGASTPTKLAANMAAAINAVAGIAGNLMTGLTATNPVAGQVAINGYGTPAQQITPDSGGVTSDITWNTPVPTTFGTLPETAPSPYTPPGNQTATSLADVGISPIFGAGSPAQAISLNFGTFDGSSGVTQFANTAGTVSVSNFSQDGLPQGSFNSVGIDQNGNVSLNYSNGTNKVIAQVPVAQFFAQDQLQSVTGGAYTSTLASGNARLNPPGTNGGGTLSSNSLEQSNVDISTEFTNLIQSQQVYSANAKLVTTDNQLLQVTLQMIQ
jgi:flagellar hook protein FlgE